MTWMPKPDECTVDSALVTSSLRVWQPWWRQRHNTRHSKSDSNAWMIDESVERWMMWLLSGCNSKWITTRCMMMHSWPHKNGEQSDGKDLGLTDQGL